MQLHHALQQLHGSGVKLGIGSLFQLGRQLLDTFGADVELMGMRHSFSGPLISGVAAIRRG